MCDTLRYASTSMQAPLFVRPLTDRERDTVTAGLRSPAAFTLRRCQILLASARQEHVPAIARALGCHTQTVRNAIHAFNRSGLDALTAGSSRPQRITAAFDAAAAEQLLPGAATDWRQREKRRSWWSGTMRVGM